MNPCTHTSDWWKEMIPCVCCGAMYSGDEADLIAEESRRRQPVFTAAQLAIIEQLEKEDRDDL